MQIRALSRDGDINAEHPFLEPDKNPLLQPLPKQSALGNVATLDPKDANLQLEKGDRRKPKRVRGRFLRPCTHRRVSTGCLSQLRYNFCVQQIHQSKSTGREIGPDSFGGSNAISSPPGMASASARLGPAPNSF